MQEFLIDTDISKFNKKMTEFIKSIQKELNNFYDTNIKQPAIFFIDSRKEIDEIWGRETEEWFCAWFSLRDFQ